MASDREERVKLRMTQAVQYAQLVDTLSTPRLEALVARAPLMAQVPLVGERRDLLGGWEARPHTTHIDGEVEDAQWAACHHYGYTEHATRGLAEQYAREHPTSIETLSYAERDAGAVPAGTGYVELRLTIAHGDGGGVNYPVFRYAVHRARFTPTFASTEGA